MKPDKQLILTAAVWLTLAIGGMGLLQTYASAPGALANAPRQWPHDITLERPAAGFTLVMLAHPHCPCTRASIEELSSIMAHCQGNLQAYVLFLSPSKCSSDWEKTDLWKSAAAIPSVKPVSDTDGLVSRKFGAFTSGQALLYDIPGHLVFNGGITPYRGHQGDSAGRNSIIKLVSGATNSCETSPVFGCPLIDTRMQSCRRR